MAALKPQGKLLAFSVAGSARELSGGRTGFGEPFLLVEAPPPLPSLLAPFFSAGLGEGGLLGLALGTDVDDWEKLYSKGFCSRERFARLKGFGGGLIGMERFKAGGGAGSSVEALGTVSVESLLFVGEGSLLTVDGGRS